MTLEEAYHGKQATITVPSSARLRGLPRHRRRGRRRARDLPDLLGPRQGAGAAGLLHRRADLPDLRRAAARSSRTPARPAPAPGRVRKDRTLNVNIPAGVETGTRIRLAGEGEAGLRGGPAGDLYIFIEVEAHPIFERDNQNLYCRIPVSMTTAALGGEIDAPTLDGGKTRVKVPAGRAVGQAAPAARQGHAGAARRRARAISTSSSRSRPR